MQCITSFSRLLASCILLIWASPAQAGDFAPLMRSHGKAAPSLVFKDEEGKIRSLKEFQGRMLAVHFWATWCVPCIGEIKSLNHNQKVLENFNFVVIPISLDGDKNMDKVKAFYQQHGLGNLKVYVDVDMKSFQTAKIIGLPSTLFIDAKGNEIIRADGALDWNSREIHRIIKNAVPR